MCHVPQKFIIFGLLMSILFLCLSILFRLVVSVWFWSIDFGFCFKMLRRVSFNPVLQSPRRWFNALETGRVFTTVASHDQQNTEEDNIKVFPHAFSIAPMMDYTNRHQRAFQRLITKKAVMYTEMVTSNALVQSGKLERHLGCHFGVEEPLVLQLGGADPLQMQQATQLAVDYGYKEININCGCPSPKVAGSGCFGASLMLSPSTVRAIIDSMSKVTTNITVKCRIGVDNNDSYPELCEFIRILSENSAVNHFIIHARKAILNQKFSPADNRRIPPLCYDVVYRLVKGFPQLKFTLNGGVTSMSEVLEHYKHGVHGVMVGRSAIEDPYRWRHVDSALYGVRDGGLSRRQIIHQYAEYAQSQETKHTAKIRNFLLKPVHNLFNATAGARQFKRNLEQHMRVERYVRDVLVKSIDCFSDAVLDAD